LVAASVLPLSNQTPIVVYAIEDRAAGVIGFPVRVAVAVIIIVVIIVVVVAP
jgi:hypothetical protein